MVKFKGFCNRCAFLLLVVGIFEEDQTVSGRMPKVSKVCSAHTEIAQSLWPDDDADAICAVGKYVQMKHLRTYHRRLSMVC